MKYAYGIAALFAIWFGAVGWTYQDTDLAWQQQLGTQILQTHQIPDRLGSGTFTASDAPWVPQEWLFSLAVALAARVHALPVFGLVVTAAALLALLITGWHARRRGASAEVTGFVVLCAGLAMQSFGVRALVFGWPLLAALLFCLALDDAWVMLAIPIAVLWANIHGSAMLAPVIAWLWAAGIVLEQRAWTPQLRRALLVAGGVTASIFMTPMSWRLPLLGATLMFSPIRTILAEWFPADITYAGMLFGVMPLLLAGCYFGIASPNARRSDFFLFVLAAVLPLSAQRHLPVAALILAPIVAQRITEGMRERRLRRRAVLVSAVTLLALVLAGTKLVSPRSLLSTQYAAVPAGAIAALSARPGTHRLYCEREDWCSLALLTPNVPEFFDGRDDGFPQSVWTDHHKIYYANPQWSSLLDRYRVDAVVVRRGGRLSQALAFEARWRRFYADRDFELYLRSGRYVAHDDPGGEK